mgnify:CR=1 FL=1
MSTGKKKLSLAFWIFLALIFGAGIGWGLVYVPGGAAFATKFIKPIGTIFVNLLKFIVVPIVLFSMVCGMISMKDIKKVGSIGWKTMVYYICTTIVALIIGLVLANIFKGGFPQLSTEGLGTWDKATSADFMTTLVDIFPSNIVAPFANASMLQIIVIALLIGAGIILTGEKGRATAELFESLNEVFMKVMMFIIKISPIGVFCMMTWVVSNQGPEILGDLAKVLGVAYLGYILHAVITYSITVKTMGGMSPFKFFKGMIPAMVFAFSSTSSVATLPINKECAVNLGASEEVSSFVLPLGATINMDGTSIMQGVAVVFAAQAFGIHLSPMDYVTVIGTATLASVGTAGVPSVGLVTLTMVFNSVGLPVEAIGLIMGIDRILDMTRTAVNITGDAVCTTIVAHQNGALDKKVFNETE